MKSVIYFNVSVTIFVLTSYLCLGQTDNSSFNNYKLIWSDEFNTNGPPDSLNWKFETGFVRNKELQWYQRQNAYCKDGVLVIEGRREQVQNPRFDSTQNNWKRNRAFAEYTSSSIHSRGLHSFKYGRFEIRARIDTSLGLWPAIWTLGDTAEWPQNGEIDIMEFYRINHIPHILANTAWGTTKRWNAKWNSIKTPLATIMGNDKNWPRKFHIWRMDWDENYIKLYLDDVLLNTTNLTETINPDGSNPFKQPHYILLNLAIGEHGGDPAQTAFPVKYEVDYVRVYQGQP